MVTVDVTMVNSSPSVTMVTLDTGMCKEPFCSVSVVMENVNDGSSFDKPFYLFFFFSSFCDVTVR